MSDESIYELCHQIATSFAALEASRDKLAKALRYWVEQGDHGRYCGAVQGPDGEEWIEEEMCTCGKRDAVAALADYDKSRRL